MLRFHSASDVSSIGAAEAMPALETQMSMPPNARAASACSAITLSSSVTSTHSPAALSAPNAACMAVVASDSAARSMSHSTTQAPSPASRRAVANPMPPAPPVISATLPASARGFGIRCSLASSSSQYSISNASCSGRPQ